MDTAAAHEQGLAVMTFARFAAMPLDARGVFVRGVVWPAPTRTRVHLAHAGTPTTTHLAVDLPLRLHEGRAGFLPWLGIAAVRMLLRQAHDPSSLAVPVAGDPYCERAWDMTGHLASGWGPDQEAEDSMPANVTDRVAYTVADLLGDPLWTGGGASARPDRFLLVGFVLRRPSVVRVYVLPRGRGGVVALDLPLTQEKGQVRHPGGYLGVEISALFDPHDTTLDALRVPDSSDPYCEECYDLTRWV
ncbi:hypothetical protein [Carbonactinospora thermoautotrophica]|uniref:hypothetical protein n=1 Tax=Carbonactinospora thermoautotrophica TaxID=1469144 RepID=UPI0013017591|nr:hypothetical protein [Carbonactinospora thermoautotrophica]